MIYTCKEIDMTVQIAQSNFHSVPQLCMLTRKNNWCVNH